MVNIDEYNFEAVGDSRKETMIAIAFLGLIVLSSALQFFKQRVLQHAPPVIFAAMTKTMMGVIFLVFIVFRRCTRDGVAGLFKHDRYMPFWSLFAFIFVLCLFGAATLAGDTVAFVYLDLSTKQVIDAASPMAVLIVAPLLSFVLEPFRPKAFFTIARDEELETTRRGAGWRRVKVIQVIFIFLMVASSVFVVWVTPAVSFTGVVINTSTLVTSAVTLVILETMLKWRVFSKFGLMVVTIIPEIIVLSLIALAVGEKKPESIYIFYATVVAVIEVALKLIAFQLLRVTSSVELSVSSVVVFALVVSVDTFIAGKYEFLRVAGLIATGVFLAVYTLIGFIWRRHDLQLCKDLLDRQEFAFGGNLLTGAHRSGFDVHDNNVGIRQVFEESSDGTLPMCGVIDSWDAEYSETRPSCSSD